MPAWLKAHVGEGDGQIAPVVLQRARTLYLQKVKEGAIKNPCYFAMDATRPAGFGRRFYVICEADQTFRSVASGHGSGRNVSGANFTNGFSCAKNFSNAMDSKLTTGGSYVTDETVTRFKGYYPNSSGKYVAFSRQFVQFDGVRCHPKPVQGSRLPIILGGESTAALARAAEYGDGWYGFNLSPPETAEKLATLRGLLARRGRDPEHFDVVVAPFTKRITPDDLATYRALGVREVVIVETPPQAAAQVGGWVDGLAAKWVASAARLG